jgi:hypothetical protein
VLPRRVVEVPAVHASETVLRSDFLPASAFRRGWGPFTLVALDPGQELALGIGVAPGVGLESPALDGLHQGCHVVTLAGLLERGVQVVVVAPQHVGVGVSGQYGADRSRVRGGSASSSPPGTGAPPGRRVALTDLPTRTGTHSQRLRQPSATSKSVQCGCAATWRSRPTLRTPCWRTWSVTPHGQPAVDPRRTRRAVHRDFPDAVHAAQQAPLSP